MGRSTSTAALGAAIGPQSDGAQGSETLSLFVSALTGTFCSDRHILVCPPGMNYNMTDFIQHKAAGGRPPFRRVLHGLFSLREVVKVVPTATKPDQRVLRRNFMLGMDERTCASLGAASGCRSDKFKGMIRCTVISYNLQ
jgi:hypothetical protein